MLLARREFGVALANKILEDTRSNSILIKLIGLQDFLLFFLRHFIVDHLLSYFGLAEFSREETQRKFPKLDTDLIWRTKLRALIQILLSTLSVLLHEIGLREKDLND